MGKRLKCYTRRRIRDVCKNNKNSLQCKRARQNKCKKR